MRNFIFVKLMKISCLFSLIFILCGCGVEKYDWEAEEESKQISVSDYNVDEDIHFSKTLNDCEINGTLVAIDETIYDADPVKMYGYTMLLDKAYVFIALIGDGFYKDVIFTIEEYNESQDLLRTVQTDSINCIASFPVKVFFESSEDVSYLKLTGVSLSADNSVNYSNELSYLINEGNDKIKFNQLSNTTFTYKSDISGYVGILDENGVQIDCVNIEKGKGEIVTVYGAAYFRVYTME